MGCCARHEDPTESCKISLPSHFCRFRLPVAARLILGIVETQREFSRDGLGAPLAAAKSWDFIHALKNPHPRLPGEKTMMKRALTVSTVLVIGFLLIVSPAQSDVTRRLTLSRRGTLPKRGPMAKL